MNQEVSLDALFSPELLDGMDINQAFHEAAHGVITDQEIALNEKVARVENILEEASSDFYREFVDLRSMAAQIEMFCNQDHGLENALSASETVSNFMKDTLEKNNSNPGIQEKDTKKDKKKKRRLGWMAIFHKD